MDNDGTTNDEPGREIDHAKRTAEALRQSEDTVQALLDASTQTALLIDANGKILALNEVAHQRLKRLSPQPVGDSAEGLIGRDVFAHFPASLQERRRARNADVIRSGLPARFEDERNGQWMDNTIHPIFDSGGKVVKLAVFSYDITDRKCAERALQSALREEHDRSRRDSLTGVLNHRAIVEELQEVVDRDARATPQAVFMVDLDGLKAANDMYGHTTGDAMLVATADTLCRGRAIVGRYGGDEFVVLLPGADRARAERFAQDVQAALAGIEVTSGMRSTSVPISVSIGLAIYPEDAAAVNHLLDLSDRRMYAAKRKREDARPLRKSA
jgi:diguanylate cyclase (GGDEF)-like protein/PAS domain S-box-containing protein